MVVLDTDIIIEYLRGKEPAINVLKNLHKSEKFIATTVFNAAELYKGCYSMNNVAKGLMSVNEFLSGIDELLIFDEKAIQEYARISSNLKKSGVPIGAFDELIASICVVHNQVLYTRNIKHFEKIRNLKIKSW